MYEIILLDADGTLFDFYQAEEYALIEGLRRYNYHGDYEELLARYRKINHKLWLELEKGSVQQEELKIERFRQLFEDFNLRWPPHDFNRYYLEKLGENHSLIDGALEVCHYLSKKYQVIIVTNGMKEVQFSRFEKSPLKQYISNIIISEQVGVNKPNPLIFEYTLKVIKHINKQTVLMVGDSLTSDIQGGIQFGIDTCWLNLDYVENPTGIQPKYEIHSLRELVKLL